MEARPDGNTTIPLDDAAEHGDTAEARDYSKEIRVGVAVLLIWWGVWTLADRLLIAFSPWSELAAVALGIILFRWASIHDVSFRHYDSVCKHLQQHLERI